jgi:hypothetical protein
VEIYVFAADRRAERRRRCTWLAALVLVVAAVIPASAVAAPAGTTHVPRPADGHPDQLLLHRGRHGRIRAPLHAFVYNAGPRPLEIQPQYNGASGNYQGQQQLFTYDELCFIAYDGPNVPTGQRSTVTGGGLNWTLVKRSDSQSGVSEIWTAKASSQLANATVTATPLKAGYDGLLDVIAFRNASGVNVAGATRAPTGAPDISLPGVQPGSWVFGVGNDWDRAVARTRVSGQVLQHQWVDTGTGDTFWVQSTAASTQALSLVTCTTTRRRTIGGTTPPRR